MLRALFRKQAMAFAAFFTVSGRDGRRRSRGMILAWSLLAAYLAVALVGMSAMNAWGIFSALLPMDLGWLAFALTGLGAVAASSVCCAFFAWSGIYQARDNELLLSLPIPAWQILLSRVSWLYLMALALTAGMFLPAAAVYQILAGFRPLALACCLLLTLTLPLLAAALSCLIGWLIALAAARVRRKAPVVVTLSLLGIAGLYWGVFQLQSALGALAVRGEALGGAVGRFLPLRLMGQAAMGDLGALTDLTVLLCLTAWLTWKLLSVSFFAIATARRGERKTRYREQSLRLRSPRRALLARELARFAASPAYMLNCGMGAVFMLAAVAAMLVKGKDLRVLAAQVPFLAEAGTLAVCAAAAILVSMTPISGPSISLEGRQLWILRSLPMTGKMALQAKIHMHLLIACPPALALTALGCRTLGAGWGQTALAMGFILALTALGGSAGLWAGLLWPSLTWTSETVAVKQGIGTMAGMLAPLIWLLALAGLYLALGRVLGTGGYLLLAAGLTAVLAALALGWVLRRGAARWETL